MTNRGKCQGSGAISTHVKGQLGRLQEHSQHTAHTHTDTHFLILKAKTRVKKIENQSKNQYDRKSMRKVNETKK